MFFWEHYKVKSIYLETLSLIEKLHRDFLDIVRMELESRQIEDLNSVQAVILFNIGKEELTIGELTSRGYYMGSNVSYNVKKLVENGYLDQARSRHDRRTVRVSLSEKGNNICALLDEMYEIQANSLISKGVELSATNENLRFLGQFWANAGEVSIRNFKATA